MNISQISRLAASALVVGAMTVSSVAASVTAKSWGKLNGKQVTLYTLTNANGVHASITNYGGTLTSLYVPDRHGKLGDVVLGYNSLAPYVKDVGATYFGALIGRYGNRIAKGTFTLDDKTYHIFINNPPNTLHGGKVGFNKRVWDATPRQTKNGPTLTLTYLSKDGEENYPGNLKVKVVYTLTNDNGLKIDYTAKTDKDTVVNLTNHSYFALGGPGDGTILGEKLYINANKYSPIDQYFIPTGDPAPVAGTPFDFRKPTAIGARINQDNEQLHFAKGYDHNFIINRKKAGDLELAVRATDPKTGKVMEVWTDQLGVQFYSGNFLNGKNVGKGNKPYQLHYGFALETQHFPDSPNEPSYPTTELKPGQTFHSTTIYKFLAK